MHQNFSVFASNIDNWAWVRSRLTLSRNTLRVVTPMTSLDDARVATLVPGSPAIALVHALDVCTQWH